MYVFFFADIMLLFSSTDHCTATPVPDRLAMAPASIPTEGRSSIPSKCCVLCFMTRQANDFISTLDPEPPGTATGSDEDADRGDGRADDFPRLGQGHISSTSYPSNACPFFLTS